MNLIPSTADIATGTYGKCAEVLLILLLNVFDDDRLLGLKLQKLERQAEERRRELCRAVVSSNMVQLDGLQQHFI